MRVQRGDLQSGALGLGRPQVDQTLAQRRVVEQVGRRSSVRVTLQMCTGSILVDFDDVAAEFAVEHDHDRPVVAG